METDDSRLSDAAKLPALRGALIEGEESGAGEPFELESFLEEAKRRKRPRIGRPG